MEESTGFQNIDKLPLGKLLQVKQGNTAPKKKSLTTRKLRNKLPKKKEK